MSFTRFEETFNKIREHFAGPQGMFRKLFGGGSADIMMLPDEDGNIDFIFEDSVALCRQDGSELQINPRMNTQNNGLS